MGSAPVTIGGGSVADLFPPQERGRALSIYTLGLVVGSAIGPIAGGFLSESEGWRWIFWVLAIASGAVTVCQIFLTEETNAVVILERKVKRLQKETGNMNLLSKLDRQIPGSEVLKRAIVRPAKLQVLSAISILMSVATAVVYGNLYLMLTTITTIFEATCGFTIGTSGLAYIGLGMGNIIGLIIFSSTSDRYLQQKSAKGLQLRPEDRLPLMLGTCPLLPIGMFWYGWSAQAETHWIVPIIGFTPLIFVIYRYGEYIRTKWPVNLD